MERTTSRWNETKRLEMEQRAIRILLSELKAGVNVNEATLRFMDIRPARQYQIDHIDYLMSLPHDKSIPTSLPEWPEFEEANKLVRKLTISAVPATPAAIVQFNEKSKSYWDNTTIVLWDHEMTE